MRRHFFESAGASSVNYNVPIRQWRWSVGTIAAFGLSQVSFLQGLWRTPLSRHSVTIAASAGRDRSLACTPELLAAAGLFSNLRSTIAAISSTPYIQTMTGPVGKSLL